MLTTEEFAAMHRIGRAQATRWARQYPRQLGAVRQTPRGPWRFPEGKAVAALIAGLAEEEEEVRAA
jgi:hypothetical protein